MRKLKFIIYFYLICCFWGCSDEDEVSKGIFIRETGKPFPELLNNPSRGSLIESAFFTDEDNGIVIVSQEYITSSHTIGNSYSVFSTSDGGNTWEETSTFDGYFYKMQFVNHQIGYLSGGDLLRKTVDGGRSWDIIYENFRMNLFAIHEQALYALQAFALNKSIDGGKTWTKMVETDYSQGLFKVLYFFNESIGFIGSYEKGRLLMTTDGGSHWETIETDIPEQILNIFFINEKEGFITAEYESKLYATKDGGNTWKLAGKGDPYYSLTGMYFYPDGYGILTSQDWVTLYTKNFGQHMEVFLNGNGDGDFPFSQGTFSPINHETLIFVSPSELYKIHINRNNPDNVPAEYEPQWEGNWEVEYQYTKDTGNMEEDKKQYQWKGTMVLEPDSTAIVIHEIGNIFFPEKEFEESLKWYKIGSDSIALFSRNTNWTNQLKYEMLEISPKYLKIHGFDGFEDLWTLTLRKK